MFVAQTKGGVLWYFQSTVVVECPSMMAFIIRLCSLLLCPPANTGNWWTNFFGSAEEESVQMVTSAPKMLRSLKRAAGHDYHAAC